MKASFRLRPAAGATRKVVTSAAGSIILATLLAASLAIADVTHAEAPANPDLIEQLSGVDFVPEGDALLAVATLQEIIDIARDEAGDTDKGLRIRAFRALGEFPSSRDLLIDEIALHSSGTGIETIYCRAAMHSLTRIADELDLGAVIAVANRLDHPSPDVRVAAAEGLAFIGSTAALPALRQRLEMEVVGTQVHLAISEAIRLLTMVSSG